jgi:hypothetical protein
VAKSRASGFELTMSILGLIEVFCLGAMCGATTGSMTEKVFGGIFFSILSFISGVWFGRTWASAKRDEEGPCPPTP